MLFVKANREGRKGLIRFPVEFPLVVEDVDPGPYNYMAKKIVHTQGYTIFLNFGIVYNGIYLFCLY